MIGMKPTFLGSHWISLDITPLALAFIASFICPCSIIGTLSSYTHMHILASFMHPILTTFILRFDCSTELLQRCAAVHIFIAY